ncbi:MAG: Gfo/Idh/MocA family oxidoreductase [Cyclobacteriaceae bacterium]
MNILIIGSGMYVTGRKNSGVGTVLSSLAQSSKTIPIDEVVVACRSEMSAQEVAFARDRINSKLKTALEVSCRIINSENDCQLLCIEKSFDLAIIAIPDNLHYTYTNITINEGIHTLVVKPFTPTCSEAEKLIDSCAKNNVYGAIEFHKRFDEANLYVKKQICEGLIGNISYITIDYSQKISIPTSVFKDWAKQTNIFQYLGVHYVDLIYFITGYKPVRLTAWGNKDQLKNQGIDTYDSIQVSIVWQGTNRHQFASSFNTNWIDPVKTSAMSDQKFKIIGTEGRVECDQKNRGVEFVSSRDGVQQINPYFSEYLLNSNGQLDFCGYGHRSIFTFLNDVLNIKNGSTSPSDLTNIRPSFKESLVSVRVTEAVGYSLSSHSAWINIDTDI